MSDKRYRLTNISFEKEGCHVALVHRVQGGPANGVTTLLTKSTADIDDSSLKQELENVEKAKFYRELRSTLEESLREHFEDAIEYNWLYLEDFNDSMAVFSTDQKIFTVGYSLGENDKYVFDDVAQEVDIKQVYEKTPDGKILVSDAAMKKLESGMTELLTKSLENPETLNRASTLLDNILTKETQKMEEIQKAVAAAVAEKDTEIESLKAKLATFEEAQNAMRLKARQEALAAVLAPEMVEATLKSVEGVADEQFEALVATMKSLKTVQTSDEMFQQKSASAGAEETPEVLTTEAILAKQFQKN